MDLWPLVDHLPVVCDAGLFHQVVIGAGVDASSVLVTRLCIAHAAPFHLADVGVSSVPTTRLHAAYATPFHQADIGVSSALTTRLHVAHAVPSRQIVAGAGGDVSSVLVTRLHVARDVALTTRLLVVRTAVQLVRYARHHSSRAMVPLYQTASIWVEASVDARPTLVYQAKPRTASQATVQRSVPQPDEGLVQQ